MHIPNIAQNLKTKEYPQIRLLLQGEPCTGKTTSALTFPNPLVLDGDNGLTNYAGVDLLTIPLHDYDWVIAYKGNPTKPMGQPNRRDAIIKFLAEDAIKMTKEQTFIGDSWSAFQLAFDQQQDQEPAITKGGKVDEFAFWAKKIEFSERIMMYLCSLKCNVVITCHEAKVRDIHTGQLLEKTQPLMQGKFYAQMKRWFTDCFRCVVEEKKNKEGKVEKIEYFWQVRSDNQFDAKTRLNIPEGVFKVEPHFKIFEQYRKQ